MAETLSIPVAPSMRAQSSARVASGSLSIPCYIWCCMLAVLSSSVGSAWDISWHESIGRDSFWTPAHMLIYLCGVLSGISCGYVILSTSFAKASKLRGHAISMWGFAGPIGAFICAWGGVAMITSAPFDNWWHNGYGLDVKILSPPHVLLALGMTAIRFGTLVMILAEMNRAEGEYRARLERLLFCAFVFLMAVTVGMAQEYTNRVFMHGAQFYLVVALVAPVWIAAVSRAVQRRWSATIVTALYTALHLLFTWLLPLSPAEPKLGPVYQHITHLVPPDFPLLLIVPAIVFDLLRLRTGGWGKWEQAALLGAAFLASFSAVQWPFADFLMSLAARNRIFAANNYPYFVPDRSAWVRNVFVHTEHSFTGFWATMGVAPAAGVLMTRLGLGWGDWMRRIRR